MEVLVNKSSIGCVVTALVAAFSLLLSQPASAQSVVTANLQVRASSVPNSCDFGVFEPEIRLTNTGDHPFFLPQAFVQVYFNTPIGGIEAVNPEGTTAAIFTSNGGFKSFDTISIRPGIAFDTTGPSADRLANQAWQIFFSPIDAQGPDVTLNPGEYAQFFVTFRRPGGLFPFDPQCNAFTKVERNAQTVFTDNKFYNLFFTSTQQFICEFLNPTTRDPNSGVTPAGISSCP